jgi:hypothetical protein
VAVSNGTDPKGNDPFELEPEDDGQAPKPLPSLGSEPDLPEVVVEEPEIDTRTVAERKGAATPRGAVERIPVPPGWPAEAFQFPLRKPGPALFVMGVLTLFLLDLLGLSEAVRFPGWMLKLMLLVFVLRAQFQIIGTSAAGRDGPYGWRAALAFDWDDLKLYWRTLLFFAGALLPGTLLWVFEVAAPGVALLVLGSMYAAVVALGAALKDPRLKWPVGAIKWMSTRPLHCLAGSLGWWTLLGSEIALHHLVTQGAVVYAFVALVLRVGCLYMLLLSARAIGVMGRAWTA